MGANYEISSVQIYYETPAEMSKHVNEFVRELNGD